MKCIVKVLIWVILISLIVIFVFTVIDWIKSKPLIEFKSLNECVVLFISFTNLLVLYLFSNIAQNFNESKHRQDLQIRIINSYNSVINSLFNVDFDNNACDYEESRLDSASQFIINLKLYESIFPSFKQGIYESFKKKYFDFCILVKRGGPEDLQNDTLEQHAYLVYIASQDFLQSMIKDMIKRK